MADTTSPSNKTLGPGIVKLPGTPDAAAGKPMTLERMKEIARQKKVEGGKTWKDLYSGPEGSGSSGSKG